MPSLRNIEGQRRTKALKHGITFLNKHLANMVNITVDFK